MANSITRYTPDPRAAELQTQAESFDEMGDVEIAQAVAQRTKKKLQDTVTGTGGRMGWSHPKASIHG